VKLDRAISDVQDAESDLADELRKAGERQAAESDVYHVGHTLAARCAQQLERLAPHAERYGAPEAQAPGGSSALETVRRLGSELVSGEKATGVLLLHDLRDVYLAAQRAELAWVVLLQASRAARDADLVAACQEGREEAERRWKWARTAIKQAAPQVLAAG
jgi:hypothetical protein